MKILGKMKILRSIIEIVIIIYLLIIGKYELAVLLLILNELSGIRRSLEKELTTRSRLRDYFNKSFPIEKGNSYASTLTTKKVVDKTIK